LLTSLTVVIGAICIRSQGLVFPENFNGEIRTDFFAHETTDAIILLFHKKLSLIVESKNPPGTDRDADAAALAPGFVDSGFENTLSTAVASTSSTDFLGVVLITHWTSQRLLCPQIDGQLLRPRRKSVSITVAMKDKPSKNHNINIMRKINIFNACWLFGLNLNISIKKLPDQRT
jgi:hypothetical protein